MLIKKWSGEETTYWMKANFKNQTAYTDVIQITLKNPWLIPKYEDDFAGIEGLRLYGWLFFYFGRYYAGLLIPAEQDDDIEKESYKKPLIDPEGNKWVLVPRNKIQNFQSALSRIKYAARKKWFITYEKNYNQDGTYSITQIFHDI